MIHEIAYNNQRNNMVLGTLTGHKQCFTTCAWMFMSHYCNDINAKNDKGLYDYLDDIEASAGNPGIGERLKLRYEWIRGVTSYWWIMQKGGIEHWLWTRGVDGHMKYRDSCDMKEIIESVRKGPVILGTKKMGGLRGGHVILLTGILEGDKTFVANDPYGNALFDYEPGATGDSVFYSVDFLSKYVDGGRCMYWRSNE